MPGKGALSSRPGLGLPQGLSPEAGPSDAGETSRLLPRFTDPRPGSILLRVMTPELPEERLQEPPAEPLEPGWVVVLTYQMKLLEEAGEVLQQLQELIPRPTLEEVAAMRAGTRPVTRYACLIGQLQGYMCGVENVASDLRVDLEYQFDPEGAEKLGNFFNGLETAVERLTPPRNPVD